MPNNNIFAIVRPILISEMLNVKKLYLKINNIQYSKYYSAMYITTRTIYHRGGGLKSQKIDKRNAEKNYGKRVRI